MEPFNLTFLIALVLELQEWTLVISITMQDSDIVNNNFDSNTIPILLGNRGGAFKQAVFLHANTPNYGSSR
ncbi:MAG: hypothetical protein MRQ13_04805 [Candidatus Midichloria sp.]|nr:hypothetical protein [Candidatus Midichloria sp.]